MAERTLQVRVSREVSSTSMYKPAPAYCPPNPTSPAAPPFVSSLYPPAYQQADYTLPCHATTTGSVTVSEAAEKPPEYQKLQSKCRAERCFSYGFLLYVPPSSSLTRDLTADHPFGSALRTQHTHLALGLPPLLAAIRTTHARTIPDHTEAHPSGLHSDGRNPPAPRNAQVDDRACRPFRLHTPARHLLCTGRRRFVAATRLLHGPRGQPARHGRPMEAGGEEVGAQVRLCPRSVVECDARFCRGSRAERGAPSIVEGVKRVRRVDCHPQRGK